MDPRERKVREGERKVRVVSVTPIDIGVTFETFEMFAIGLAAGIEIEVEETFEISGMVEIRVISAIVGNLEGQRRKLEAEDLARNTEATTLEAKNERLLKVRAIAFQTVMAATAMKRLAKQKATRRILVTRMQRVELMVRSAKQPKRKGREE